MAQEDEEDLEKYNSCVFCGKGILSDKVHDHCHSTAKYRGLGLSVLNFNVTQFYSISTSQFY